MGLKGRIILSNDANYAWSMLGPPVAPHISIQFILAVI